MPRMLGEYEVMTNDYEGTMNEELEPHVNTRFRVRIRPCGNIYSRRLYDVDGNVLKDEEGNLLNVYTASLNDYFAYGQVRLVRSLKYDYRYFVTCEEQKQRFMHERENGSEYPRGTYYVYLDVHNEERQ